MSLTPRPDIYSHLDYLGGAGGYVDDVYDVISKSALFEEFSRQEIEALCQFMHCFAARRGDMLLNEGEEGDYLLIVLSGEVTVRKLTSSGVPVDIAVAPPGTTLGEMSLIDGQRRFASCIASEPTDIAVITRHDLNEILVIHPRLANKFLIRLLQVLVVRLRDTGTSLIDNYLDPVN